MPANVTTPDTGALKAADAPSAMSTPRCCPPAYGSPLTVKPRSTAPSAGHAQAHADGPVTSAATIARPTHTSHLVARGENMARP